MLSLNHVHAGYGKTVILEDVSFDLAAGQTIAVLGRNGVGKTTLIQTIMGHSDLHSGQVSLRGRDISKDDAYVRSCLGLGLVPQEREIFRSLSVEENLDVAARPGKWTKDRVQKLFPILVSRSKNLGGQLSGGEQQMLAIARALVGNPSVLLLDEPLEGLAPVISEQVLAALEKLRDEDLSVLLIEQKATVALEFASKAIVLDRGRMTFFGDGKSLLADESQLWRLMGSTVAH